jgi:hypothetical protein
VSSDPIGDALRADAEEARISSRAAGLICPSCGQNAGDLYGRHCLVLITRTPVSLDRGFGHPVAAANIALMDDLWFRETMMFRKMGLPA